MEQEYNYKKGIPAVIICFFIWGFQPLYWSLCKQFSTLFLLASRIILAGIFCFIIICIQGKVPQFVAIFKERKVLRKELFASVFLFLDWTIFLFAVQNGKVLETSLGYYIEPIIVFLFGAIIFKERVDCQHYVVIIFLLIGIFLSIKGFDGIPYYAISLPLFFSIYSAIKKSLEIDSLVATTFEIVMMAPIAAAYLIFASSLNHGTLWSGLLWTDYLALLGSGIVTGLPMLFYSIGNYYLPLTFCGISQYISPTFGIFCSLIMGEVLTKDKLISFIFIWMGIVIYTWHTVNSERKRIHANDI